LIKALAEKGGRQERLWERKGISPLLEAVGSSREKEKYFPLKPFPKEEAPEKKEGLSATVRRRERWSSKGPRRREEGKLREGVRKGGRVKDANEPMKKKVFSRGLCLLRRRGTPPDGNRKLTYTEGGGGARPEKSFWGGSRKPT